MDDSHKIEVSLLDEIPPVVVASATTVDGTQQKRLYAEVGQQFFRVTRRRLTETLEFTIYGGDDFERAVGVYNVG
jgi:hypothetical protein